ncbi:unnamed protein product [Heligmosomoides polygyrus]|uniref:RING-type domain-containing protein n=1 Tax=Heligmosomoides polygyrus TaxID=6339 RepID=A0A3P8FZC8_HELPZ|nr:unnamed protein product [Heligmosomoides polygyrus]
MIDAITVIDCLHTFCKSCLLTYFEEEDNCCPTCEQLIHQSHPSHYVAFDRTMQDIVYKLVPGRVVFAKMDHALLTYVGWRFSQCYPFPAFRRMSDQDTISTVGRNGANVVYGQNRLSLGSNKLQVSRPQYNSAQS